MENRKISIEEQIQYAVTHGIITMYESLKLRRKSSNKNELEENFERLLEQKINGN